MKRAATSLAGATTAGAVAYVGAVHIPGVDPRTAANVLLTVIGAALWVFVLLYGIRSRWQATLPGRALMYLGFSFAAVVTQVAVSVWTQSDYPLREPVRFILYFTLAATVLNLVRIVLIEQREDRKDRR